MKTGYSVSYLYSYRHKKFAHDPLYKNDWQNQVQFTQNDSKWKKVKVRKGVLFLKSRENPHDKPKRVKTK